MRKVLLLLNGPNGFQKGIEDGFSYLEEIGKVSNLKFYYFEERFRIEGVKSTLAGLRILSQRIQPDLVVFFHTSNFPFDQGFIEYLKSLDSKPVLVYDEGDMYGGISKPLSRTVKNLMKRVDYVSVRGLGKFRLDIESLNPQVLYTPHSNSLHRITANLSFDGARKKEFIFIGNCVKSRLGNLVRLSGARAREKFVISISKKFPNLVTVHGRNWDLNKKTEQLKFDDQVEECSKYWFHLSYEHYPEVPYYFSDRLPISLACGQIYVCHYHDGYDKIFDGQDFIYFYKTTQECEDIMLYLMSLNEEELKRKSLNAIIWANKCLSPNVVWGNLYDNIFKTT